MKSFRSQKFFFKNTCVYDCILPVVHILIQYNRTVTVCTRFSKVCAMFWWFYCMLGVFSSRCLHNNYFNRFFYEKLNKITQYKLFHLIVWRYFCKDRKQLIKVWLNTWSVCLISLLGTKNLSMCSISVIHKVTVIFLLQQKFKCIQLNDFDQKWAFNNTTLTWAQLLAYCLMQKLNYKEREKWGNKTFDTQLD